MITDWFQPTSERSYAVSVLWSPNPDARIPLCRLLGLQTEDLTPFAQDLTNTCQPDEIQGLIEDLARGIHAFLQYQDMLAIEVDSAGSPLVNRHYCYYEALVHLREAVASWLNRNTIAANALLRSFMELAVTHVYWLGRASKADYEAYYSWLDSTRSPGTFRTRLSSAIDNCLGSPYVPERRLSVLSEVLNNVYRALCDYHHRAPISRSQGATSGGWGSLALDYYLQWLHLAGIILRQVLYLFILAYPNSVYPVPRATKWGFTQGPVGIYFDEMNYLPLARFLGENNLDALRHQMESCPEIQDMQQHFAELPLLKEDDLEQDWRRFCNSLHPKGDVAATSELQQRVMHQRAFQRSANWALNYVTLPPDEDAPADEDLERIKQTMYDWPTT